MASSNAEIDPQQVRQFARELGKFADRVTQFDQRMAKELSRLGESFRDQDYEKFRDRYKASRMKLQGLVEDIHQVKPKLEKDAQQAAGIRSVRLD